MVRSSARGMQTRRPQLEERAIGAARPDQRHAQGAAADLAQRQRHLRQPRQAGQRRQGSRPRPVIERRSRVVRQARGAARRRVRSARVARRLYPKRRDSVRFSQRRPRRFGGRDLARRRRASARATRLAIRLPKRGRSAGSKSPVQRRQLGVLQRQIAGQPAVGCGGRLEVDGLQRSLQAIRRQAGHVREDLPRPRIEMTREGRRASAAGAAGGGGVVPRQQHVADARQRPRARAPASPPCRSAATAGAPHRRRRRREWAGSRTAHNGWPAPAPTRRCRYRARSRNARQQRPPPIPTRIHPEPDRGTGCSSACRSARFRLSG